MTLFNPDLANNYKRNCATFNPTDDLVLNDGVLWDVRSAQAIHKFDKFNMNISGVFHPNGLEVIINTEIVSLQEIVYLSICHLICYTELFWATLLLLCRNQLLDMKRGERIVTFGRKGIDVVYVYGIICRNISQKYVLALKSQYFTFNWKK